MNVAFHVPHIHVLFVEYTHNIGFVWFLLCHQFERTHAKDLPHCTRNARPTSQTTSWNEQRKAIVRVFAPSPIQQNSAAPVVQARPKCFQLYDLFALQQYDVFGLLWAQSNGCSGAALASRDFYLPRSSTKKSLRSQLESTKNKE